MIEPEKKGSTWPWIAVPVAAVIVFLSLGEGKNRLPGTDHGPATAVPAAPDVPAPDPQPSDPETSPPPATPAQ